MTDAAMDELPDAIHERIEAISDEGNVLIEDGNALSAIARWQEALTLLPSPVEQWDAAMWLHASIGDGLRSMGRYEEALTSFRAASNASGGAGDAFVQFHLGATLVDLGREDEAIDPLLRAYMAAGMNVFDDFGRSYVEPLERRRLIGTN